MTQPPATKQTLSYLMRRFNEVGIRPNGRHGQNFLIDLNLQHLIVEAAELEPHDVVLEVGTGTGALTAMLAQRAAAVVSVEIDARLYQMASEDLYEFSNVTLLQQDALKNKNHLDPNLVEVVERQVRAVPNGILKLVANLPYNVATPVIANLLSAPVVPRAMVVTIQKELAERILAVPGTRDYSALSVWIQSQCRVQLVRTLPASVFWPRPRVTSAIIRIDVDDDRRAALPDRTFFHDFVRDLFCHRRKFLRGELQRVSDKRLNKDQIDELMRSLDLPPTVRAEELPVDVLVRLSEAVRSSLVE